MVGLLRKLKMDEMVMRAMAKWPNVPDVYGWLSLDQRGNWRVRGERLAHRGAVEFIGRNYQCDGHGRWFFQNGPQRVFVLLDYVPWVLRLQPDGSFRTQTGVDPGDAGLALIDEEARLVLATPAGPALVDDRDLVEMDESFQDREGRPLDEDSFQRLLAKAEGEAGFVLALRSGLVPVQRVLAVELPNRCGFVRDPSPGPTLC